MFDFDEQQDILSAHGASLSNHKSNSNANSTTTKSRRRTLVSSSTGVGTGTSTGTGTGMGTNVIITSANMDTILRSSRNITSIEGEKEGEGEQAMKSEPDTRSVGLRWRSGICSRLGPRSSNEDRPVAISDLLEAVKLAKEEENANVEVEVCMESFIRIGVETAVLTKIDNNAQNDLDVMSGTKEDTLGLDKEVTIETWTDLSACCSSSIGTSANNDSQSVSVSDSVSVWQAVCSTSCITLNTVDFFITPELSEKVAEERSEKEKQKYDGNKCETKDDCKSHIKSERQGYFAVYDGHCGAQAAVHLQENLHFLIFNHPLYDTDVQTAIIESCVTTDRDFLAESREKKQYSGTTALGAIVRGNELTVFNIGDCHAVLCCDGVAVDMSDPHKPNRPDEAARILAAKGWITEEKELYMARLHRMDLTDPVVRDKAQLVSWVTIYRVCGEISVSRSIGDPDYKSICPGNRVDAFFLWPEGHDQVRSALCCT